MYDDINKIAQVSANTFKDSLQYLVDAQNQQKILDQQVATERYQNLLNQINQQRTPVQQQYAADSQAAYINKMLTGKQIGQNLSQMGLNSSGFGVGQQLANETSYGQNLNQLMLNRNQLMQGIDNQVTNATGEYNANQTTLEATYAGRLTDLNKYITEATQNKYNTVYNQMVEDKKYQDQLAQLAWENDYKNRTLAEEKRQANLNYAATTYGFGDSTGDTTVTNSTGTTNTTPTKTYKDTDTVTTNYTPNLSSKNALSWLDKNITSQVIKNKNITVGNLKKLLSAAYSNKTLNESDVKKILKSFGLE